MTFILRCVSVIWIALLSATLRIECNVFLTLLLIVSSVFGSLKSPRRALMLNAANGDSTPFVLCARQFTVSSMKEVNRSHISLPNLDSALWTFVGCVSVAGIGAPLKHFN